MANEIQRFYWGLESSPIDAANVEAGTFQILFWDGVDHVYTADIAATASAATIEAALEAVTAIGSGNVSVTLETDGFSIEFIGALAETNIEPLLFTEGATPLRQKADTCSNNVLAGGSAGTVEIHYIDRNGGTTGTFDLSWDGVTFYSVDLASTPESSIQAAYDANYGAGTFSVDYSGNPFIVQAYLVGTAYGNTPPSVYNDTTDGDGIIVGQSDFGTDTVSWEVSAWLPDDPIEGQFYMTVNGAYGTGDLDWDSDASAISSAFGLGGLSLTSAAGTGTTADPWYFVGPAETLGTFDFAEGTTPLRKGVSGEFITVQDGLAEQITELSLSATPSGRHTFTAKSTGGAATLTPDAVVAEASAVAPTLQLTLALTPDVVTADAGAIAPTLTVDEAIVSVDVVTANASIIAPTLAVDEAIVSVDVVTANASVVAPTLTVGAISAAPDAVLAEASAVAPTLTVDEAIVSVDVVTANASVVAPTLTVTAIDIAPDVIAANASVVTPDIVLAALTLSPDTVAAEASAIAPTIELVGLLTPDVVLAEASVIAPDLTVDTVTLVADVILANASAITPTLTLAALPVTPDVIVADATVITPDTDVTGTASIIATEITANASAVTPDILLGAISLVADTIVAEASVLMPTITLVNTLTPDDISAEASAITPLIVLGVVTFQPPSVDAEGVVVAPDVTVGEVTLVVPTVDAESAAIAPDITLVFTFSPDACSAEASAVAPDITLGVSTVVSPEVLAEASVVAPAVTVDAVTVTVPAVEAEASVISPAIYVTVIITPDAISADATVLAPTLTVGAATVSPDVVSANAEAEAPTLSAAEAVLIPAAVVAEASVTNANLAISTITFVPDVVAADAEVEAPTVVVRITVPVVLAEASVVVPGITLKFSVTDAAVCEASVVAPTVVLTLYPDVVLADATADTPTLVMAVSLTTPPALCNATVVSPTVVPLEATLTPDACEAEASAVAPDVLTGDILTADVIVANATAVTPTVVKSLVTLTPDVIVAEAIVVDATLLNPSSLTPDTPIANARAYAPTLVLSASIVVVPAVTANAQVVAPTRVISSPAVVAVVDAAIAEASIVSPTLDDMMRFTPVSILANATVIAPTLEIGEAVYTANPLGRRQISVDQAQGGQSYPFLAPSDNLGALIGDFYLSYSDNNCQLVPPFSISWLRGFGTEAPEGSDPGGPNTYDMLIVDANGETVFDTTEATFSRVSDWSNETGVFQNIIEWINGSTGEILRVVRFAAWEDVSAALDWPSYFEPTDARLDHRSIERAPPRLTAISVVNDLDDEDADDVITSGQGFVFANGYNSLFNVLADDASAISLDGGNNYKLVELELEPGLGLGRFPCEPELLLRRINGVEPTINGNITIDATDCYRLDRPITPLSGTNANVVKSTLKLSNDCGPCCDCEDFINVYEGIRRLDAKYREIGKRAEAVRDQMRANKSRWETSATCRSQNNIQAVAEAFPECKVAFGVGICNTTDRPMLDVTLRILFEYGPDANNIEAHSTLQGCISCNSTTRRGNVVPGSGKGGHTTAYKLEGSWPEYTASFDCINPGSLGVVTWVMLFDGCSDSDVIEFVVLGGNKVTVTQVTLIDAPEDDCCEPEGSSSEP